MGVFHDVNSYLAEDIAVREVKDRKKVGDYFRLLISGGDKEKFDQLADYLTLDFNN